MLTSSVRSCSMLAAALVASIAFTAAPAFAQAVSPPRPPRRPRSMRSRPPTQGRRADRARAHHARRAEAPVRETVMNGLMMLAFMDPDDPNPMGPKPTGADLVKKRDAYKAVKTSITAALKPSGLDAAIGKPLMPAEQVVDEKIGGADPLLVVPAIMDAAIKAGPAFGMKGTPPMMKLQPFTNLKVDGDHATVKSGPRTMKIDKIGGKWLVDAPLPDLGPGQ